MFRIGIRLAFWLEMVLEGVLALLSMFLFGLLCTIGEKLASVLEQLFLGWWYRRIKEKEKSKKRGKVSKRQRR